MKPNETRWAGLILAIGLLVAAIAGWLLWLGSRSTGVETPASPSGAVARSAAPGRRALAATRPMGLASIAGQVNGPSGAPIAGALVCASVASTMMSPPQGEPTCATTAQDGQYRLSPLRPARWTLFASAQGHRPRPYVSPGADRARALDLVPGEARTGVDFTLPAGGTEVRGQVQDIGGGGIAGALVSFLSPSFSGGLIGEAGAARTDAQGSYVAWLDEGPYVARAQADGYAEGWQDGRAPGAPIEIILMPGSVLVGRVVEAGTGEPVAGATVKPGASLTMGGSGFRGPVSSDDEGRFRLDRLAPGRYKPIAQAPGGHGEARESVLLGLGQTSSEVVIELHPARNVAGRVLMAPGQEPCPEGSVGLLDPARSSSSDAPIAADGWVRFEGMLPGSYQAFVMCMDRGMQVNPAPVVVGDADREDLVWTVQTGLTLRGQVVDRERRPVRASVFANPIDAAMPRPGSMASSEEDGRFVLRGLLPGKHQVMVDAPDHVRPEPVEVEILDEHTPELTLVVDGGSAIEGTITDQRRRPVAGADIMAMGGGPRGFGMTRSLADGSFVLKGLEPGDYRLQAMKAGVPLMAPGQAGTPPTDIQVGMKDAVAAPGPLDPYGPSGVLVNVKAGAIARVQLVVENQDGEIHGRVVDESGVPVTDAFIHPQRESESAASPPGVGMPAMMASASGPGGLSSSPALTDPEGEFTVRNLSQGTYTLYAQRNGGGEAVAEHVGVGQTVTLTLRRTGTIAGTLTVRGGAPPAQFMLRASKEGIPVREESFLQTGGAWTLGDLPEGKYQIDAMATAGMVSAEVSLASGEQRRDIALTLEPLATIKGRMVSLEDGAPLAGVILYVDSRLRSPQSMTSPPVSDGSGNFQLDQVGTGSVVLTAMLPSGPSGDSGRDGAFLRLDVQPGATLDLGPIPMAKRRLTPPAPPGDLGFSLQQASPAEPFAVPPHQVVSVQPGGPAEAAGLRVGDVIVSVDGHDVTGRRSYLYQSLSLVPAGTTVTLGLAHGPHLPLLSR